MNSLHNFEISIIASDIESPRQITETEDGHLIVGSKSGDKVIALIDKDKDFTFLNLNDCWLVQDDSLFISIYFYIYIYVYLNNREKI